MKILQKKGMKYESFCFNQQVKVATSVNRYYIKLPKVHEAEMRSESTLL